MNGLSLKIEIILFSPVHTILFFSMKLSQVSSVKATMTGLSLNTKKICVTVFLANRVAYTKFKLSVILKKNAPFENTETFLLYSCAYFTCFYYSICYIARRQTVRIMSASQINLWFKHNTIT